jgi:uncharacterized protein (DUF1684 family)
MPVVVLFALLALPDSPSADPAAAPSDAHYQAEIAEWRRDREAQLRAPDGWLALVGLVWLKAGASTFGGAPDDAIRLPPEAPAHAGTLFVEGTAVRASLARGLSATLNGKPAPTAGSFPLVTDAGAGPPSVLGIGSTTLQVIVRGGRPAARLKDPRSAARLAFAGLTWFPVAPAYRAAARLVPAASGAAKIVVPDATGGRQELDSPGTLAFTLHGRVTRLIAVLDGPDPTDLLVVFRDATSGRETYGGGRFLRARRQPDGTYGVDFNRAYSPPCAFTPYATCPLPPAENRLAFPIPAGEKAPAH